MRKNNNSQKTGTPTTEVNPIYFNSDANSPIDLGELNLQFYQHFVQEFGSYSAHRHLWPGETLLSLIQNMKKQCQSIRNRADRKRAAKLIQQYKSLYKSFVNE
jgi:hypothetical protein